MPPGSSNGSGDARTCRIPCLQPPGRSDRGALPIDVAYRLAGNCRSDLVELAGTIGAGRGTCRRASRRVTEKVNLTPELVVRQLAKPKILCIEPWTEREIRRKILWIPVDNHSAGDAATSWGRMPVVELARWKRRARRWCGNPDRRGAWRGPSPTGGSSTGVVREHPPRVLAQRRHQHMKRGFNRRIVSAATERSARARS